MLPQPLVDNLSTELCIENSSIIEYICHDSGDEGFSFLNSDQITSNISEKEMKFRDLMQRMKSMKLTLK